MVERPFSKIRFKERFLKIVYILASCNFIIAKHKRAKIQELVEDDELCDGQKVKIWTAHVSAQATSVAAWRFLKLVFRLTGELSACMHYSSSVVISHELQQVIHIKVSRSSQAAKYS